MRSSLRLLSRALKSRYGSSPAGGLGTYRCYARFPSTAATLLSDSRSSFPASHFRSSLLPDRWTTFSGQRRTMFIQTQSTPNPSSLMFHPGKPVMEVGSSDFPNARSAMTSPLAKAIFGIDGKEILKHFVREYLKWRIDLSFIVAGIVRVFYGSDFVTVTKSDDMSWDLLKPEIFAAIMDFYSSGQPLFLDSQTASAKDTAIQEVNQLLAYWNHVLFYDLGVASVIKIVKLQDDSETVAMIKELLETRIRPAVQDDGGDIEYCGFDQYVFPLLIIMFPSCTISGLIGTGFLSTCRESGVVKLRMQGACSGCPSSSVTLKSGIENMLMHYVSEVKGVEQELDGEEEDDNTSLAG
ncbi:NifU-like protein 4, mitochondrial [Linum grandiflorum]